MKIKSIESWARTQIGIVRVRTDDGAVGWGQVSPFNADITAAVLHRQVAPQFLGHDPADLELLVDRCLEATYKFPGSYVCRAMTGVDTAIWDLWGRLEGQSVCALLGGRPRPFPVYGSSMRRDITPDDEAARLVDLMGERGYRAFKIRIGKVCGHDLDQWAGRTEALVPTVRRAIGNKVSLLVDANSCYTPAKAIEVASLLQENGVCHLEEPCPYWELEWTAEVTRAVEVPVAGGEQDYDLQQWKRIIGMRAVDIVQPDICYIGGLTRALRVAKWAANAGLPCVPHSANRSMVTVFTLHMMGAIANAGPHVEFSIEPTGWVDDLLTERLEAREGMVHIPEGPGWGVEVRPSWLEGADYQISEWE
jgi:L-alanine-DL-glutamate epimerase-like enolase superfamily enzyme